MASEPIETESVNPDAPSAAGPDAPVLPGAGRRSGGGLWIGLLLLLLVLLAVWYFRPRGGSFAQHLPGDTLVWARYTELGKVAQQPEQRAAIEDAMEQLRNQGFAAALLKQHLDLEIGPDAADEFIKWLGSLRSVDLLFQGVGIQAGGPSPELLAILEFRGEKELERLVERLAGIGNEDGDHDGVPVYALARDLLAGSGVPLAPCYAVTGKRLLLSLDRDALEKQLDNLKEGPKDSLAKDASYQRAAKRVRKLDNRVWVSGKLVEELADLAPGPVQKEMRSMLKATGLTALRGMYFGADNGERSAVAGLLLDESSNVYKAFALPSEKSKAATWLPAKTSFIACGRVGDGKERLAAVLDYITEVGMAAREFESPKEVQDAVREMKEEAGVDLDKVAEVAEELGFFVIGDFDDDNMGLYLETKGKEQAQALLEEILESPAIQRTETKEVEIEGVTVTVGRWGTAFAQLGECVVVVPEGGEELMKRIIEAGSSDWPLAKDKAYAVSAGGLPKKAGARLFVRADAILAAFLRQMGPMGAVVDMPGIARKGLAGAATVTMDGGVVEARGQWAQTK